MNKINVLKQSVLIVTMLTFTACGSSLVIQNVDYSQPIESVLTPDSDGMVHDQRYAIKFSVSQFLELQEIDRVEDIRLIRNNAGYYFVTAAGFTSVYVFEPGESELLLSEEIELPNGPISNPAFNQRTSHIELIDGQSGQTYNLDQHGIQEQDDDE